MRGQADRTGNFWVELTRSTICILRPASVVLALALVRQGVVQTIGGHATVPLLQPTTSTSSAAVTDDLPP